MTDTPRARTWVNRSRSVGTPGESTTRSASLNAALVCGSTVIPNTSPIGFSSTARTRAPSRRSNRSAATPDLAIPTTTTLRPLNSIAQSHASPGNTVTVTTFQSHISVTTFQRHISTVTTFQRSFNVVSANNAITRPAIQNRVMIFDSGQPSASK